jgi:hypothetical protein
LQERKEKYPIKLGKIVEKFERHFKNDFISEKYKKMTKSIFLKK